MSRVLKNEAVATNRVAHMVVTQDDGATPADPWIDFTGFVFVGSGQSLVAAAGSIVNRRIPLAFADITFTAATGTNLLSATGVGTTLNTGFGPFRLTTTGTMGGILTGTDYWAIFNSANDIKVATSYANALAGIFVTVTANSTGTCKITTTGATNPQQGVPGAFQYTFSQAETNVAANELTAIVIKSGYARDLTTVELIDPAAVTHVAVDSIADAAVVSIWDGAGAVLEGSYTSADLIRFIARWLGGKASDFRTTTITIRDLLDTKNCITVTTADSGRVGLMIIDPS